MTVQECYKKMGGDFSDVVKRLMTESLVKRFVVKFLKDDSYQNLCEGMKAENREEAFRAAHTLKGVCQNLGLKRLSIPTEELTELLRGGAGEIPQGANLLLEKVTQAYQETIEAIQEFADSEGM